MSLPKYGYTPEATSRGINPADSYYALKGSGGGGGGGVNSVVGGSGIAVDNTDPANPVVSVDVTAGTGIQINTLGPTPVISNTGVTEAIAGTGISLDAGVGPVTITNSGVTSIVAGAGISVSGTGAVTVSAPGVSNALCGLAFAAPIIFPAAPVPGVTPSLTTIVCSGTALFDLYTQTPPTATAVIALDLTSVVLRTIGTVAAPRAISISVSDGTNAVLVKTLTVTVGTDVPISLGQIYLDCNTIYGTLAGAAIDRIIIANASELAVAQVVGQTPAPFLGYTFSGGLQ